jgi:drug/metabolite transporter (DMT)-like permease
VTDRVAGDDSTLPYLGLAVAVLGISWSAILIRWSAAPSDVVAFYRVGFTLLAVAPIAILRHRRDFARIGRRDLAVAMAAGVALAIHFLAWIESLAWTSVATSVTLVQTQPVFVAIGAVAVLGERVNRRTVVGILTAIGGAIAMTVVQSEASLPAGGSALVGSVLAVTGALAAAAYVLTGRSLRQRIAILPYVTVVYAACVATLFVAVAIDGGGIARFVEGLAAGGSLVTGVAASDLVDPDAFVGYPAEEWLLFAAMALGPGLLGHTVVNWTLEHLRSTVVSVSLLGEPVGATLLGVLLLGEVVGPGVVATMAVVLAGIYLTATARTAQDDAERARTDQ